MDALNKMFFNVDQSMLKGPPVDEKTITILDGKGNLRTFGALDARWRLLPLNNRYQSHPLFRGEESREALVKWRDSAAMYCTELNRLTLGLSYERFWCNAVNQPENLLDFLRSFSMNACRSYDMVVMAPADAELHSRISGLVFLCVTTLCCNRRTQTEHLSPKRHVEFLQKFIRLPFLMDMCALYTSPGIRQRFLAEILLMCFTRHRSLFTGLRNSIRDLGDSIFQKLEDDFNQDPDLNPLQEYSEEQLISTIGYLCDMVCTLQRIVTTASGEIFSVINDAKLSDRLVRLANNVIWFFMKEICQRIRDVVPASPTLKYFLIAKNQCALMEYAVVDVFRRLKCPASVLDELDPNERTAFLATLSDTLQHNYRFAVLYEKWTPVKRDVERIRAAGGHVDESVVDLLAHTVKQAFQSEKLSWDYFSSGKAKVEKVVAQTVPEGPRKNDTSQLAKPAAQLSAAADTTVAGPTDLEFDSKAAQIVEVTAVELAYAKECLKHYNGDMEKTVDAIFTGSVPVSISDLMVPQEASKPVSQPAKAVENYPALQLRQIALPVSSSMNAGKTIEKVYFGKRDAYETVEHETMSDETKAITIALVDRIYDDEYDDTYDDFEGNDVVARMNERKDPVAKELETMRINDSLEPELEGEEQVPAPGPRGPNRSAASAPVRGGSSRARGAHQQARDPQSQVNQKAEGEQRSSDPWTRQMQDNYNANVTRRERGRGGPPRAEASTGDPKAQANKEKNKATRANHNRKDGGQWKRSQGMYGT